MSERPMPTGPKGETYPSNNDIMPSSSEAKIERMVGDSVKLRKKPLGQKLRETFISDDANDVKTYLLMDVVVPAIKDTINDVIVNGVSLMLYGDTRPAKTKQSRSGTYITSYDNYFQHPRSKQPSNERLKIRAEEVKDFVYKQKSVASGILGDLIDAIVDYDFVTVATYYEAIQNHTEGNVVVAGGFPDHKYGWTDLSSARVRPVRGGYIIDLPRPVPID